MLVDGIERKISFGMYGKSEPGGLFEEPRPEGLRPISIVTLCRTSAENKDPAHVQFALMVASEMDPRLCICDYKTVCFAGTNAEGFGHVNAIRGLYAAGKTRNPRHELLLRITVC
ncbi:hypothetical protein V5O48_019437, partial [Marasmius crinis-equi]